MHQSALTVNCPVCKVDKTMKTPKETWSTFMPDVDSQAGDADSPRHLVLSLVTRSP